MSVFLRVLTGFTLVTAAYAQPRISDVTNAASYISQDLPNGSLARGSYVVVKGSNLGPANIVVNSQLPFPTQLSGTSVKVTVGTTTVDGYMYYALDRQIAFLLPSQTPAGSGTLTVTANGQTSAPTQIRVANSAFGLFALNQNGSGPGNISNVNSGTDLPFNTLVNSARPGQQAILWGTGLGPALNAANETAQNATPGDLPVDVQVFIGGKPAPVAYKGRSGCCVGLDQLNITVPADVVEGCYVPVVVRAGGLTSNFTTMAISRTGGACTDVTGLTGAQLRQAETSGTFRTGSIVLLRNASKISLPVTIPGLPSTIEQKTDIGSANFVSFNFSQLVQTRGVTSAGGVGGVALGSCTVFTSTDVAGGEPLPQGALPTPLDAGAAITIRGPKGDKQLPRQIPGIYSATLSTPGSGVPGLPGGTTGTEYLDPGSYTISGPGGANVSAFTATAAVPALLNWTNMDQITEINRSNDLRITWSGGDANSYVFISGTSATVGSARSVTFACLERASAQAFNVPSWVLSSLPATSGGLDSMGFLSVTSSTQPTSFTAPGLDAGIIVSGSGYNKNLQVR